MRKPPVIKKAACLQAERRRMIDTFHNTRTLVRVQRKLLLQNCTPDEKAELRRIKPLTTKQCRRLDARIRGLDR